MIAYALLALNIKRGLGMFEQHSQVRASDSFQAASYHYLFAKFVGQVCIDENLGLLCEHDASIADAETQIPAESLITASIGNLKMFGEKYEKLCAKQEDDDEESSDGAAEPSNYCSRDEGGTWKDAFGFRWKEIDTGYCWQDEDGTWLPYTEESDDDIDENAADKGSPKKAAI